MTKGELLAYLQPFVDEIEIVLAGRTMGENIPLVGLQYDQDNDGNGIVVISPEQQ